MIDWLFTNALAALVLAAIAGVLIWTFRPAPAVRHALWLVVVLKLVAPGGPTVSLPFPIEPTPTEEKQLTFVAPPEDMVVEAELFTIVVNPKPGQTVEEAAALAIRPASDTWGQNSDSVRSAVEESASMPEPAESEFRRHVRTLDYRLCLLTLWVAGGLLIAYRQVRETVRFARFARQAKPAPDSLIAEVVAVAGRLGVRVPAVRVLAGLTSPVMWCLGRPVLLWPAGLECRLKGEGRRAVIAHELAHLRRRDHWVRRLEMVAAVLHWWNPLFWVARKKMRADAELACDAWAAGQADRRAYAEALLEVCSFNPRRRPAPAVGVFGEGRRAMQERLTMIMRDRVPCRLAFGAKLVIALMAIAAIPAWTLGQGKPETVQEFAFVEVADTADSDDAAAKELENQIKALAQKLEALKAAKRAEAEKKAGDQLKRAQETLGAKLQELRLHVDTEDVRTTKTAGAPIRVLIAGKDGVQVIGPDGKEIKDVKVIIGEHKAITPPAATKPAAPGTPVEARRFAIRVGEDNKPVPAIVTERAINLHSYTGTTPASGSAITLSRATYKLGKDQATALGTLLGSIKATVMETKVDGDSITVTTTPDAQAAIGQIVHLIQGHGGNVKYEWKSISPPANYSVVPAAPSTAAPPAIQYRVSPPAPATPAKPAQPSTPEKKPMAGANPEKVNVNVILEKLKPAIELGTDAGLDMATLEGLLKTLKPLDLKIEGKIEKPATNKKPDGERP